MQKSNEMYFNYFDVTPGPKVQYFNSLLQELKKAMENPGLFEAERKRVLNIFYSKENQQEVLHKQVDYIYKNILKI